MGNFDRDRCGGMVSQRPSNQPSKSSPLNRPPDTSDRVFGGNSFSPRLSEDRPGVTHPIKDKKPSVRPERRLEDGGRGTQHDTRPVVRQRDTCRDCVPGTSPFQPQTNVSLGSHKNLFLESPRELIVFFGMVPKSRKILSLISVTTVKCKKHRGQLVYKQFVDSTIPR